MLKLFKNYENVRKTRGKLVGIRGLLWLGLLSGFPGLLPGVHFTRHLCGILRRNPCDGAAATIENLFIELCPHTHTPPTFPPN